MARRQSTTRGFKRTASVLSPRIRKAGEARGFAVSRLLTHWAEIVGEDIARAAHPVDISYGRQGFGATLTILTTGAEAPLIEMQKQQLREKVNAVYGYNAIARVRITQTAATGFGDAGPSFVHAPRPSPDPRVAGKADDLARPVENDDLRLALERLGRNVLSKNKQ